MYEMDEGIKPQENGQWNCPLKWWKENHMKFPYIWLLAQLPSRMSFSAASNIIRKNVQY
jgi:hypothetical protein